MKEYTLSEIGAFLLATSKEDKRIRAERLTSQWMGTNLTKEGLDQLLAGLGVNASHSAESASPKKVQQEWKRLASFINKEMR